MVERTWIDLRADFSDGWCALGREWKSGDQGVAKLVLDVRVV